MDENMTTKNSQSKFCRKCGSQLLVDSVFCSKCGTKVEFGEFDENKLESEENILSSYDDRKKQFANSKKKTIIRTTGIISSVLLLAAVIVLWIVGWYCTYAISYYRANFHVDAISWILWSISIVSAVALVIVFAKLVMYKTKYIVRITSIVVVVVLLFYSISSVIGIYSIQDAVAYKQQIRAAEEESIAAEKKKEEESIAAELEKNRLKYTEISIPDFNSEIARYPSKFNGSTIKLEGYAYGIDLDNNFYLCFPEVTSLDWVSLNYLNYSSKQALAHTNLRHNQNFIFVNYAYNDKNAPKILQGDYVVITGIIEVYTVNSANVNYPDFVDAKIVNATYEIKSLTN